jgi:hypothetical protein
MTQILNATIAAPGTFTGLAYTPLDPKLRFIPQNANVEATFVYGSGGTSVDVYLQTTHDGANWRDIGHFGQLTTSTVRDIWRASSSDSVLDADIQNPAPPLSWWRVRYVVVGTYAGTNLAVNVIGADLVRAGVGP